MAPPTSFLFRACPPSPGPCPQVEEVFTLPLAHLLQAENQGYTHFCKEGRFDYTLPVFLHGPHRIWGLTAVITEFTLKLLAPDHQTRLFLSRLPPKTGPGSQ